MLQAGMRVNHAYESFSRPFRKRDGKYNCGAKEDSLVPRGESNGMARHVTAKRAAPDSRGPLLHEAPSHAATRPSMATRHRRRDRGHGDLTCSGAPLLADARMYGRQVPPPSTEFTRPHIRDQDAGCAPPLPEAPKPAEKSQQQATSTMATDSVSSSQANSVSARPPPRV